MKTNIIVAYDNNKAIGKNGEIPWKLNSDLRWFKNLTTSGEKNAVIMGRKTWESITKFGSNPLGLKGRLNIVLSTTMFQLQENPTKSSFKALSPNYYSPLVLRNYNEAIELCKSLEIDNIFCIGGSNVYKEAMEHPSCQKIFITHLNIDIENPDTYFPEIDPKKYFLKDEKNNYIEENNIKWKHITYLRRTQIPSIVHIANNHEEYQYLNAIKDIIKTGVYRDDRTGTGTISKFGIQMRFDLENSFPLLTTKKVFFRGIIEELLWFLRGETDSKILTNKKVRFWDKNGSKENLIKLGFSSREEGDLGPVYGFQWRNFGGTYIDKNNTMKDGEDQIYNLIFNLRNYPNSRRHILSAWNPKALKKMALPPCHILSQFWVNNGYLSCQMYQRSGDMGLGVPFNIASYSALTYILANICNLKPGELVHVIGDAHVYLNHVDPLKGQINLKPFAFPKLKISKKIENISDISQLKYSDFILKNYKHHKSIKMEMST